VRVQVVPTVTRVFKIRKSHHELHEEVFPPSPINSVSQAGNNPAFPRYPTLEIYKASYPHFNIYPRCAQASVPLVKDAPRQKMVHKSHEEVLHCLTTTIPDIAERPTAADRPTILPLRLRRRVPSLDQLNGRNSSPPQPRVSPAFDGFPSIERTLSQSEDETTEPLDMGSMALTRSQSLPVRPTTPKRGRSALITQKIKALNATMESPDPDFDHRSTRSLPISLTGS